MKKIKLLPLCIILALSQQNSFAATPLSGPAPACPKNIDGLSQADKDALPAACQKSGITEQQLWITGGALAGVAAVVGIAMSAGGGGGGGSDDGGSTPPNPDDGGNTPPNPDDGGNTPPNPDDGGNTPPNPDDGGDTPPNPDDGGDTPPDPDDGGDTPDQTPVTTTYPNGLSVTMVPGATTASLTLSGETMQAVKQANGTWLVTDSTGKTYTAQTLDQATGAITGYSIADRKSWTLDATTPTGKKIWTSQYYDVSGVIEENDTLFTGAVVTENREGDLYTIYSAQTGTYAPNPASQDVSDGLNIAGRVRVENNAIFLNSGKMTLSMRYVQSNQGFFHSPNGNFYVLDSMRLDHGRFINTGSLYNNWNSIVSLNSSDIYNSGTITTTGSDTKSAGAGPDNVDSNPLFLLGGDSAQSTDTWTNTSTGVITAKGGMSVLSDFGGNIDYSDSLAAGSAHDQGTINAVNDGFIDYSLINSHAGKGDFVSTDTLAAVSLGNSAGTVNTFVNNGTMTVTGSTAVAMSGQNNTTLVNNGTINLGDTSHSVADNGTGLVAFKAVGDNVTAYNQGTVNINANDSYVFDRGGSATAHLVNTGEVNVRTGVTSGGLVKGESSSVVDTTSVYRSTVSNYTVGTTAAGTSGTMTVSHADLNDVSVDTGFTSGTAAQTQTFDNVFVGEDIQGAENIQSTSVVWSASAQTDQSGNVDVTMSKNSYQDVVSSDASAQNMAATLDANYTNNALYSSLNLQTASEVDKAMRQLSGVDATTAFKEARVLSQRFNMLADNAIVLPSGFGFNLVDKNDKRSELGNDTRYDMMALSQSFDLSAGQKMQMQYGIARLDGNGIDGKSKAGDNGLTGGYSQFFGINHSVDVGSLKLTNALRYDVHQLESNRSIRYSGVNQTASSDNSQQYMEWRSQFSRGFDVAEGLNLTPSVGMKLRHTNNDAYSERGAGDFNLNMDSSNETAVDAVIGVQMKYAASNGWAMNALLEGGPNLSYTQSAQKASLQGANNASFTMNDDQQGGGFNGVAKMGLSYGGKAGKLAFDAYQWKEDDIVDKGLSLGYQYNF